MSTNNNLSCIPFYPKKEEQDFRLWYAYGEKYPHFVPSDYLVPFFFSIPYQANTRIDKIEFYKACCGEEQITGRGDYNIDFSFAFAIFGEDEDSFGTALEDNGLTIDHHPEKGYSQITYFAAPTTQLNLPKGMYYIKIVVQHPDSWNPTYDEYYSDVIFVDTPENLAKKVCIEWYNRDNLEFTGGYVPYEESYQFHYFKNKIYLDTTIGMPEYSFTEDGEERNGHFFPIKQISEKTYKMSFIAPEYLCDVMRLIRMSDRIKVTDGLGRVYNVEQFEMNVTWAEQGHYAEVECSFQTDTVVKKVGKAYNNLIER